MQESSKEREDCSCSSSLYSGEVDEEAEDAGLEWSGGILRSHVDSHNVLISAGSALL